MGKKRNNQAQRKPSDQTGSGEKAFPWFPIIAAIIAAIGYVIVALINRSTALETTLKPIEFTQTAEALHTSIAIATQSAVVLNTSTVTDLHVSPPIVTSTSTPAQRLTSIDEKGVETVNIAEGYFIMGSTVDDVLVECNKLNYQNCTEVRYGDSAPPQQVYLMGYYIDKFEVTNKNYLSCVNENECQEPTDTKLSNKEYFRNPEFSNYPVVHVTWNMAKTYCEWRGARLPTEAEWEKAARGVNGQTYPWGNTFDCKKGNFDDEIIFDKFVVAGGEHCDGYDMTSPVGSFNDGASPFGIFDMAGNVWEWVSSLYKQYPYDAQDGREDTSIQGIHVIRGGSWLWYDYLPATYHRVWIDPNTAYNHIGFRCARDVIP